MKYREHQKVIFNPDSKIYDFGYYSQVEGMVVLYEEGECSMQDSFATKENNITPLTKEQTKLHRKHERLYSC